MVDKKGKTRLLVVTVILLAVIGYMVYSSSASQISYYKKIGEVTGDNSFVGKSLRVGGLVEKGSIVHKGRTYTFTIYDKVKKDQKMTVVYSKSMPSQFGAGVFVIADGKLVTKDKLEADSIVTQCPSKYQSDKKKQEGK
ncbi:MAG TPA: cytochrome c maturation protein CcmE [Candidatus Aquicultor sp.]|jgi:cytochrome c-type biogenesis protein CcmE